MKTLAVVIFGITGFTVHAQKVQPKVEREVNQEMILRESPPEADLFYNKGDQIGVIKKDTKVQIIDSVNVKYFYREERWYKVREVKDQPSSKEKSKTGWVYAGKPHQ